MARNNFGAVLDHVYKYEGGFVNHPKDPGGATNFGITKRTLEEHLGRTVSIEEVRNLGRGVADEIYKKSYWAKVSGDHLPQGFDLVAMDGAVNSGPRRGAKWLQKGLGVTADGKIGGLTLEAAREADQHGIEAACRRVASVEASATRMWLQAHATAAGTKLALEAIKDNAVPQAENERRSGAAQASTTGVGGAGGVTVADMPPVAIAGVLSALVIVAALLYLRAERKARYHEDRREAYASELETLK
jgi:lysozyme family protein